MSRDDKHWFEVDVTHGGNAGHWKQSFVGQGKAWFEFVGTVSQAQLSGAKLLDISADL
jgi:hypothetical protein